MDRQLDFLANWSTWFLGDIAGVMIVFPLVLAFLPQRRCSLAYSQWGEFVVLLVLLILTGQCIFGGGFSERLAKNLLYIPLIFLFWVSLRFQFQETVLTTAQIGRAHV